MLFKCKIGFHSWDGCKCSNCGKMRNEQHLWDGYKCSKCGKTRSLWINIENVTQAIIERFNNASERLNSDEQILSMGNAFKEINEEEIVSYIVNAIPQGIKDSTKFGRPRDGNFASSNGITSVFIAPWSWTKYISYYESNLNIPYHVLILPTVIQIINQQAKNKWKLIGWLYESSGNISFSFFYYQPNPLLGLLCKEFLGENGKDEIIKLVMLTDAFCKQNINFSKDNFRLV